MIKNTLTAAIALIVAAVSVQAQGYHYNRGYFRQNGTYVPGHYQTNPNGSRLDNWSTEGNYNPFTGRPGYKSAYPIFSGPDSGLQHYNSLFDN
jgi:hypothetical protein